MRPPLRTCHLLLLVVGLLTAPTPGSGAAIATRAGRALPESGGSTSPTVEELGMGGPPGKVPPETSRLPSGAAGSLEPSGEPSATAAGAARQPGTDALGPLLDADQLFALELNRTQKTGAPPTSGPAPVAPSVDQELSAQLGETLKSILEDFRPPLQGVHRPAQPPPPPPEAPDTAHHLQHILPSLEETLGGILKDSEARTPATASRPREPTVFPARPVTRRPFKSDDEEHLMHILPTLEETLGGILKDSEAELSVATSRPEVTPVRPATADVGRPCKPDVEDQLKDILPELEAAIGSILKDSEVKVPATTGRPEEPPVFPATVRPLKPEDEEHLKHILPALQQALGGILQEAEADAQTTPVRPVLTSARPMSADAAAQFSAVLPQLEAAIGAVLDAAARRQQVGVAAATPAWRPPPPTTGHSGFAKFVPELERVLEDILRDRRPDNSTVKTPVLPATASTEETQSNVIETGGPSPQAVQSASQDAADDKEAEGKTPREL